MTPQERSLLEQTRALVEENNTMLRSILRSAHVSIVLRVIYWTIILGLSFGAYYVIEPYLKTLIDVYGGMTGNSNTLNAASALKDLFQ